MAAEYLDDRVVDLNVARSVRKVRQLAESALVLVENRQVRLHGLSHLFTSTGAVRPGAVEDWRECSWASCQSTRSQVDAMRGELADLG